MATRYAKLATIAKPELPYTAPPGVPLTPITAQATLLVSASRFRRYDPGFESPYAPLKNRRSQGYIPPGPIHVKSAVKIRSVFSPLHGVNSRASAQRRQHLPQRLVCA